MSHSSDFRVGPVRYSESKGFWIAIAAIGAMGLLVATRLVVGGWTNATAVRIAETRLHLMLLQAASSNYFSSYGVWPRSIHDFDADANPQKLKFIDSLHPTNDAWGWPIVYIPFDPSVGYGKVVSYGRDGKLGGVGPDADIEAQFGK